MMSTGDISKIQKIVRKAVKETPDNLRVEAGAIRFTMFVGEDKTRKACNALLAAGLQHIAGDGEPEFHLSFTEGAKRVKVRWPYDPELPVWNE